MKLFNLVDAKASLLYPDITKLINPYTFSLITANVTQTTSQFYTTNWTFNTNATLSINNNNVTLNPAGPFSNLTTSTSVALNSSFFSLGKQYVFNFTVFSVNQNSTIGVAMNWTIPMNDGPKSNLISNSKMV